MFPMVPPVTVNPFFLQKVCIPHDGCLYCCLNHKESTKNLVTKHNHSPHSMEKGGSRIRAYGYKYLNIFTTAAVSHCSGNLTKYCHRFLEIRYPNVLG